MKLHARSCEGRDDYGVTTNAYGRFDLGRPRIPGRYVIELSEDLALQARKLRVPALTLDPVTVTLTPGQDLELELTARARLDREKSR